MRSTTSSSVVALAAAAAMMVTAPGSAHTVLVYPGTRGNNLITNDTFPYGMQWIYPCGGMGTSRNRTYWPTTGGAVSFQPGWFQGHETALMSINLGLGTDGPDHGPPNMSFVMQPMWQIRGPTKNPYPGTFCLPQVQLPKDVHVKAGDLATIQLVELALHGAALFTCVDIVFADPGDPRIPEVNESNCFNSVELGSADVYTIVTRAPNNGIVQSGASRAAHADEVLFWHFGRHRKDGALGGWLGIWALLLAVGFLAFW